MILTLPNDKQYKIYFTFYETEQNLHIDGELKNIKCKTVKCAVSSLPDMDIFTEAEAVCSPKDNFNRHKGRKLAFKRAVTGLPWHLRQMLWGQFLSTSKRLLEVGCR